MTDTTTTPRILGRLGHLETRLAQSQSEIEVAQKLRFDVFYTEMGAAADETTMQTQRDADSFDDACEHLLVIDNTIERNHGIVGTYRFLDSGKSDHTASFYSAQEFDLTHVTANNRHCLELGRSCIAKSHRSRRTMELAWHGIWSIVVERHIDVMFGCASFHGTNLQDHAAAFSLLHQDAMLEPGQDAPAIEDGIALADFAQSDASAARTLAALPPLLKGYLRLGAKVSSQAVIDEQFGTTDVLVVLDVAKISQKYIDHYGANAQRFAA